MKKELLIILSKKSFWIGLLLPILITVFFNLGIIFSIPNQISFLQNITEVLSQKISNDYSLQILIGLFTVFVVFFTFAQFSYSNKLIPTYLIRKYIIEADETVFYIGTQFGFIIVLSYSGFFYKTEIHQLNIFLNLLYLFLSALLSVIYFFWLTKNIQASNVFRLILRNFNKAEIAAAEKKYYENLKKFEEEFSSTVVPYKLRSSDPFGFFLSRELYTVSYKFGVVSNIRLTSLVELLKTYQDYIEELILDVKIGEYLPKYDPLPDISPKTVLLKIIPKLNLEDDKLDDLKKYLDDSRVLLESVFNIDEKSVFGNNKTVIKDLIDFYFYSTATEPGESESLIKEMNNFFVKEIVEQEDNEWILSVGLTENLYLEFIQVVEKNLKNQDLTKGTIEATLTFIYAMKYLAHINGSLSLMRRLIDLLTRLIYDIIASGLKFKFYLSTLVLYIKEVTILTFTNKDLTKDEFLKIQSTYFQPIVFYSIEQASKAYYYLIMNFNKIGLEEGKRSLIENGNNLIDFLFPLNQWSPIDNLIIMEEGDKSKLLEAFVKFHAANLLYLSLIIFIKTEKNEIPIELLKSVAFKLTDNCQTIFKHTKSNLDIIDELFYDYGFNNPSYSIFSQELELDEIHEYGTYSPTYHGFSKYWVAYSIYNRINGREFVPRKLLGEKYNSKILLEGIKKQLEKFDNQNYSERWSINSNKLGEAVSEYLNHIKDLLNKL